MTTSDTLLDALRTPGQPEAWSRFVRLYSPLITTWIHRKGLQEADTADLVQDVFRVLVVKLPEFEYDRGRGFRKWLMAIAFNTWRNHCRQWTRREKPMEADLGEWVDTEAEAEEYRKELVARGLELIRPEFREETWKAFQLHGIEGRPAAEVAAELGKTEGAIYAAKARIVGRLRGYLGGLLE